MVRLLYLYLTGSTKILKYLSSFNRNSLRTCVCNALSSPEHHQSSFDCGAFLVL